MYDVIVIGAGHNGLIVAAKLGKAGKKVLVLERRNIVGGACVTEEIYPRFKYSPCAYTPGMFQQSVAEELQLSRFGYELLEYDPAVYSPHLDGRSLIFWNDIHKTTKSIATHSQKDALRYPEYEADVSRYASILRLLWTAEIPDPGADWQELLIRAAKTHGIKQENVQQLMRVLPMSIADLLNEYFEDDHLKGALASEGVFSSFHGPYSAGSVYIMLYLRIGRGDAVPQQWPLMRGGMGTLSNSLAHAAQDHGAVIRTGAEVAGIAIKDGRAQGVCLANGEEMEAQRIVSNGDAKHTFLELVKKDERDPGFLEKVRGIRARGVSAKVNFALSDYPRWKNLTDPLRPVVTIVAPDMHFLERAFQDAENGRYSQQQFLDIAVPSVVDSTLAPEGKHVMSVYCLFAPYHLRNGDWNALREPFGDAVTRTIETYAPGFSESILHRHVVTPLDLEKVYGLTEGHVHHQELTLDQVLSMRPVAGYANYRTPIRNLYLCGASTHPGGGVTGIPGTLAAHAILHDF